MELHARYTFFAEGARGSLTKQLKKQFDLEAECQPQVYGIGIKELWDVDPAKHKPGTVIHTQGWPLDDAWGGGWIYHQDNNQVSIGFVVALSYKNPHLSPFDEMQRYKQHPAIRPLAGGRAARVLRRAGDQRGRLAVHPQAGLPGRRADRLLGRLRERAADQGHAHGDEVGHAGGRSRVRAIAADRRGDVLRI
jgi:electron-transferring-flavoprotein dehydrogenase